MDDEKIDVFLEHYGVKGMKWGIRNQKRYQTNLDRLHQIVKGKASEETYRQANREIFGGEKNILTKKRAFDILQGGSRLQRKINAGGNKVDKFIGKLKGIDIATLNYHTKDIQRFNPSMIDKKTIIDLDIRYKEAEKEYNNVVKSLGGVNRVLNKQEWAIHDKASREYAKVINAVNKDYFNAIRAKDEELKKDEERATARLRK